MDNGIVNKELAGSFLNYIRRAGKVVLLGHENPDGDCLGCTSAMLDYIENMGIGANVIVPGKVPQFLRYLFNGQDGASDHCRLVEYDRNPELSSDLIKRADLFICMDFNSLHRINILGELVGKTCAPRLLIDHHPLPQTKDFDLVLSETTISSASELTFWLIRAMNELEATIGGKIKELTPRQAESLYTGMITDTNNFCNSVYPSTHRMAAFLLESGVNSDAVHQNVFNSYGENRIRLIGYLTGSNMKLDYGLKASCMTLSKEQQKKFDFKDGDAEGIVNMPLAIKDVMISALFTEGEIMTRLSLRSKDRFVVNDFAKRYFNGGGHPRAAGGRLQNIPFKDIEAYFFKCLAEYINQMEIK